MFDRLADECAWIRSFRSAERAITDLDSEIIAVWQRGSDECTTKFRSSIPVHSMRMTFMVRCGSKISYVSSLRTATQTSALSDNKEGQVNLATDT